jgi:phosphoribosylformylglycinamidine synthase
VKVTGKGPFTQKLGTIWQLPIAHGDGRYQASDAVRKQLQDGDRIALRYCAADGDLRPEANPNGSVDAIAGIYGGPSKNVFGLMPHPERMSETILGGADGRQLFESVLA